MGIELVLLALFALGGVAVAAASDRSFTVAAQPVATKLRPIDIEPLDDEPTVSEANGWRAVFVDDVRAKTMEWGACVWDLKKESTLLTTRDESRAVKAIIRAIGWLNEYVIQIVKAATLDVSICFRVDIPAARWEIDGMVLYSPCEPEGAMPGQIAGWNPGTTRPGFTATLAPWPHDEDPENPLLVAWIRNLGDLYGWGEDVWQILSPAQGGAWKSWPAMKRAGWRRGLVLAGETRDGGTFPFGREGLVDYFKRLRCPGQEYRLHVPSTRVKAMNRFD